MCRHGDSEANFHVFLQSKISRKNRDEKIEGEKYGGGPRGKPGTAMERVKELLDHVNCESNDLECDEMHIEFVYCIRYACALGKKSVHGRTEARAHTAVLASG